MHMAWGCFKANRQLKRLKNREIHVDISRKDYTSYGRLDGLTKQTKTNETDWCTEGQIGQTGCMNGQNGQMDQTEQAKDRYMERWRDRLGGWMGNLQTYHFFFLFIYLYIYFSCKGSFQTLNVVCCKWRASFCMCYQFIKSLISNLWHNEVPRVQLFCNN